MRRDSFLPSRNGFRFPNAFGERGTAFGLGAPLLPSFGLGAGMAWAALDRYLSGRPVPSVTEPPARTDPLHAELVMRQANALAAAPWSRLVEWQCLPERALPGRPSLTAWSRAQWQRTRRSLDAGIPMMLFLVLADGRHANPSSNKAVLAVSCEIDRSAQRATILVYDPERPGNDTLRLVFRTGGSGPLDARFGETHVRGFFSVPYDREVPASLSLDTVDDTDAHAVDAVIAMRGSDRADGPLEILATQRGGTGLLKIRRDRPGRCSEESVPKPVGTALVLDAGAVTMLASNRILARAASGDLLEFRRRPLLGWRLRNITRARRIGDAFRIDGNPAALARRNGLTVIGCSGGKLVRYRSSTIGGWKADVVNADRPGRKDFVGTPALVEQDGLHLVCRTDSGDLVHLHEQRKIGWTLSSPTTSPPGRPRFVVADDPIVLKDPAGKALNALTRSKDGAVLLFRWTDQKGWSAIDLTASARPGATGLPAAASPLSAVVDEEGTVHVVTRDAQGGLIHLWCARTGARGGEQVTRLRAIGEGGRIDGSPLLATGPAGALHVVAHQEKRLLFFRCTPVGGWSVESVSRERRTAGTAGLAGKPVLACVDFTMHIAFADETGRLYHACAATRRQSRLEARREARAERHRFDTGQPLLAKRSHAATESPENAAAVAAEPRTPPLEVQPALAPRPAAVAAEPLTTTLEFQPAVALPPAATAASNGNSQSEPALPAREANGEDLQLRPELLVLPNARRTTSPDLRLQPEPTLPARQSTAAERQSRPNPVLPFVRETPAAPVRDRAGAAKRTHVPPVVAAPTRPVTHPHRTGGAHGPGPHTSPSLEGLPLLPDEDSGAPRPAVPVRTSTHRPAAAAALRRNRNELEIQRIMALAEENPAQLLKPE